MEDGEDDDRSGEAQRQEYTLVAGAAVLSAGRGAEYSVGGEDSGVGEHGAREGVVDGGEDDDGEEAQQQE